ncbi:multiple inositol polyphosphate phosphatase 1-like [Planococcus citri]|uniref:multiple inositol polyphosphate phosphatase 1-like n=1 Tax=Planococcus citri TaxID=170843 RepID=UPI0031F88B99
MKILFELGVLLFFILRVNGDETDYCYEKDENPYRNFSTWTAFNDVRAWWYKNELESGCKPIYVWSLLKHGVRSFTSEEIKRSNDLWRIVWDIKKNYEEKRSTLCWDDYDKIRSSFWKKAFDKIESEKLVERAYFDHQFHASHMKGFIDSAHIILTKDYFDFQISKSKGANDTAIKFSNELLNTYQVKDLKENGIVVNDTLLRTRSNCSKWTANNTEADAFIQSSVFQFVRLKVSTRLGFTSPLSVENITAIYESCALWRNLILFTKARPLCAAFTPDDLKVMEYYLDLKHYYEFGYGNSLSKKIGCSLVKDMLNKLRYHGELPAGDSVNKQKKGTFYFADDENLMGMITKMGLYHDDVPLKHDNYQFQKRNRKWRSSSLSPFTATLHVVLFNCNNNEKTIEFFLNRNNIKYGACKDIASNRCPLKTFLAEVQKNIEEKDCDEDFCKASGNSTISYSFIVMIGCFLVSRL